MFSEMLDGSPAMTSTIIVVQKLPYNHNKTIPETASNKKPRVNPTKSVTKATMACKTIKVNYHKSQNTTLYANKHNMKV